MERVISKDGTPIAFYRGGAGAPLVLVHGTGGTYARWKPLFSALEQRFTVYAIDRRGRGESGDTQPYTMEREFEDVAAVVDSIGEPVNLLGHSHGAICSLEAALRTTNVHKLILYEPPLPLPGLQIYADGVIDRLEALLGAGEREEVVTTFMREIVRMPPRELAMYRSLPAWPARVAAAQTLPRELRAQTQYVVNIERFSAIRTPTLLLLGGDSPSFFKEAIQALHETLPHNRLVVLPGQQHVAMDTAPEMFLRAVTDFLSET